MEGEGGIDALDLRLKSQWEKWEIRLNQEGVFRSFHHFVLKKSIHCFVELF